MREYLRDIITNFKAKTLREADRLLKLNYETVFKIKDHKSKGVIPDVMTYHSGRSAGGHENAIKSLSNFEKFRIREITGWTYSEYLEIPRPMLETIQRECFALAQERDKIENARREQGNNMLEAQLKAMNNPNANPSSLSMKQ